ncbi:MAG: hypothetical protein F6K00_23255 [Leptolyngbya sp. SIOISBB]|nr:hypothetical protein [Leptolyngbya sp. SIOISBB]
MQKPPVVPVMENETALSLSTSERIYQKAKHEDLTQGVSEVSLLSVKLLNYLAQQDGIIQLCNGETYETLVMQYFPRIYKLDSQTYLVEQVCYLGAYNIAYSYLLYFPVSPVDEIEMSRQPSESYRRDTEGYYIFTGNSREQTAISQEEIFPLSFTKYRHDAAGNLVPYKSHVVGGRQLFDSSERLLSLFSKHRGTADCGLFAHYQLVENEFQLIEYRYQECCSSEQECTDPSYGRSPEEYPRVFP